MVIEHHHKKEGAVLQAEKRVAKASRGRSRHLSCLKNCTFLLVKPRKPTQLPLIQQLLGFPTPP